jgi:fatty acid desaturase
MLVWAAFPAIVAMIHWLPLFAAIVLIASPFASLWIYVRLHEAFHLTGKEISRFPRHLLGIGLSAPIGFSWQLYARHHANHHRYNNGPGDYSSTIDRNGRTIAGSRYLLKNAGYPFVLQLVPFFSTLAMKSQNRSGISWLDEAVRVGFRFIAFLIAGWPGLGAVLAFQLVAVTVILYSNYLQHFELPPPNAHDWTGRRFAKAFLNFGAHAQHHQHPEIPGALLSISPAHAGPVPLWSPRVLAAFLRSPASLSALLATTNGHETGRSL